MIRTTKNEDGYTLSTGNTFYANCGIIGLDPELDCISEGYDGTVWYGKRDEDFTKEELKENLVFFHAFLLQK